MQKLICAAAIGFLGLANAPVQAMEIAPLPASAPVVTLVSGGCGIGFHRGPYGGCRPNGYYGGGGVVVGAPAYGYHGVMGFTRAMGFTAPTAIAAAMRFTGATVITAVSTAVIDP